MHNARIAPRRVTTRHTMTLIHGRDHVHNRGVCARARRPTAKGKSEETAAAARVTSLSLSFSLFLSLSLSLGAKVRNSEEEQRDARPGCLFFPFASACCVAGALRPSRALLRPFDAGWISFLGQSEKRGNAVRRCDPVRCRNAKRRKNKLRSSRCGDIYASGRHKNAELCAVSSATRVAIARTASEMNILSKSTFVRYYRNIRNVCSRSSASRPGFYLLKASDM